MSGGDWIVGRPPQAPPVARLYCFPHSGGSTGEYLRWSDALPGVDLRGVNLPGRAARLGEPPLTALPDLVAALLDEAAFRPPFVLFGHSFGALLAYEVARELARRGRELPDRVVLSAYPPPHLPRALPPLRNLPDEELLAALDRRYGGLPAQLHQEPELLQLVLPAYRADLTALETYEHRPGPAPGIPLEVFAGERDEAAAPELLQGWREYTVGGFRLHRFPGGHFYFREDPSALLGALAAVLGVPAPAALPTGVVE